MTIPDDLSDEGQGRFLKWMGVSDAVVRSFPRPCFTFIFLRSYRRAGPPVFATHHLVPIR